MAQRLREPALGAVALPPGDSGGDGGPGRPAAPQLGCSGSSPWSSRWPGRPCGPPTGPRCGCTRSSGSQPTRSPRRSTRCCTPSKSGSASCSAATASVVGPDVTGQTQSVATATLQDDGLTVNPATTTNCAASSAGLVAGQSPSANASVHPDSAVTITVCQPAMVMVPSVIGMTESQAEAVLLNDGLVAAPSTVRDCQSGQPGTVINQSPDGGNIQAGGTADIGVAGCLSTAPAIPPPT
jgi:PASTA domain